MALTYTPPTITVSSQGAQTPVLTGPGGKVILVYGTAPKGPDFPVLISPAQAVGLFGDPSTASSVGYTIPYLLYFAGQQRQQRGVSNPVQFLVCRNGVTRASYALLDVSAGVTLTLRGVGTFAGTAGNALRVTTTVLGGKVTSLIIFNGTTVVQQFLDVSNGGSYDLSTNAKIVQAITGANSLTNPNSVVTATIGTSALVPAVVAAAAFTGGADGKGAAFTDAAGSGGLLDQSLWANADYLVAGYDAGAVAPALIAHVANGSVNALAQNQFQKLVLGPVAGTPMATGAGSLTGGTYNTNLNDRLVIIGHDAALGIHPALGTLTGWDGFYLAACFAGLKATGGPEQTCSGQTVNGLISLLPPPDKTAPLTQADLNSLATSGYLTFEQPLGQSQMTVRDAITTAPYQDVTRGGINAFYQFNVRDIDDTVSLALVRSVQPLKAQPRSNPEEQKGFIKAAVYGALQGVGTAINGINSVIVTTDPTTLATVIAVSYVTRYPLLQITIPTSFTFLSTV